MSTNVHHTFVIGVVLCVSSLDKTTGFCEDGWVGFEDECYMLESMLSTWHSAKNECRSRNGHLVNITSKQQFQFIFMLVSRSFHSHEKVWTGGNDIDEDGTWSWSDSNQEIWSKWSPGEPNGGRRENCLALSHGEWNDYKCDGELPFICTREKADCDDGWHRIDDRCYKFWKEQSSWADATKHCAAQKSRLTDVTSQKLIFRFNLISFFTWRKHKSFWIGGSDIEKEGAWVWPNKKRVPWTLWAPQEPPEKGNGRQCLAFATGETFEKSVWYSDVCSKSYSFICSKTKEYQRPSLTLSTHLYKTWKMTTEPKQAITERESMTDHADSNYSTFLTASAKTYRTETASQNGTGKDLLNADSIPGKKGGPKGKMEHYTSEQTTHFRDRLILERKYVNSKDKWDKQSTVLATQDNDNKGSEFKTELMVKVNVSTDEENKQQLSQTTTLNTESYTNGGTIITPKRLPLSERKKKYFRHRHQMSGKVMKENLHSERTRKESKQPLMLPYGKTTELKDTPKEGIDLTTLKMGTEQEEKASFSTEEETAEAKYAVSIGSAFATIISIFFIFVVVLDANNIVRSIIFTYNNIKTFWLGLRRRFKRRNQVNVDPRG